MSVGTNIKRLRDRAGMTQEELADKLGVARSTVTQWENGWSNPRMRMVQKLAGVFHVTSSDTYVPRMPSNASDKPTIWTRLGRGNYINLETL